MNDEWAPIPGGASQSAFMARPSNDVEQSASAGAVSSPELQAIMLLCVGRHTYPASGGPEISRDATLGRRKQEIASLDRSQRMDRDRRVLGIS